MSRDAKVLAAAKLRGWDTEVELPAPWRSNGAIAWRSKVRPRGKLRRVGGDPLTAFDGVFFPAEVVGHARIGDSVWGYSIMAIVDSEIGCVVVDETYLPAMDDLRLFVVEREPNCLLVGLDDGGVPQVYLSPCLPKELQP